MSILKNKAFIVSLVFALSSMSYSAQTNGRINVPINDNWSFV